MDGAVATFVDSYRALGLAGEPFTSEQVDEFERWLGLPLPAAYRAYLLLAGGYPPSTLVGSHCHGERLRILREGANDLLRESGDPFSLSDRAVVFWMHQGYQFSYFEADGKTEDPEVWYYYENKPAPKLWFPRLSAWVAAYVKE